MVTDLKTNFYHLDEYLAAQRAMRKFIPDAEWVLTPRGEPWCYPDHVAASWGQDDLLIVEGDIVVTPIVAETMRDCPAPWCVFEYPLGRTRKLFEFGYGCTKWSLDFQKFFSYERVLAHGRRRGKSRCLLCAAVDKTASMCRDCQTSMCHIHQDVAFWHEMIMQFGPDVRPHVHGVVEHLHVANTRAYIGCLPGVMLWAA